MTRDTHARHEAGLPLAPADRPHRSELGGATAPWLGAARPTIAPGGAAAVGEDPVGDLETHRDLERRGQPDFEFVLAPYRSLSVLAAVGCPDAAHSIDSDRARVVGETLARCEALEDVSVHDVEDVLASAPEPGGLDDEAIEHRALTRWMVAVGASAQARRWSELDERRAGRRPGDWRDCQADLAELLIGLSEGRPSALARSNAERGRSMTPVEWYSLQADFYWHVIRSQVVDARRTLDQIIAVESGVPPRFRGDSELLRTLCDAVDGSVDVDVALPDRELSLADVRSALVGGEAVALGGSREAAERWYGWFEDYWPAHVLRAPVWPVLAHRVRALLACRSGDIEAGRRWMDGAILVADRIGSPVEAALARIQYAELLGVEPPWNERERWSSLVQIGRDECRRLGVPYEHHAYRARTAAVLGRFDLMSSDASKAAPTTTALTSREIEVLRLFSAGHSYRQAAEVLGVGWRTVQSHAYNAYQKLGVSSKIAAVTAASRLHLL